MWLVLSGLCLFLVPSEQKIRGVCIQDESNYANLSGLFYCHDRSKYIPFANVNDDYCDCEDGSDEPGTNACPNSVFCCDNIPFKVKKIEPLEVDDKNCNCCDGSDEIEGFCPNTCKDLYNAERQEQLKAFTKIQTGKIIRDKYAESYHPLALKYKDLIPKHTENIVKTQQMVQEQTESLAKLQESLLNEKNAFLNNWKQIVTLNFTKSLFEMIDEDKDNLIYTEEATKSVVFRRYNMGQLLDELETEPFDADTFVRKAFPYIVEYFDDFENRSIQQDIEQIPAPEPYVPNEADIPDSFHPDEEDEEFEGYGEDGKEIYRKKHNDRYHDPSHQPPPSYKAPDNTVVLKESEYQHFEKLQNPTNEKIESIEKELNISRENLKQTQSELDSHNYYKNLYEKFFEIDFGVDKEYGMMYGTCYSREIGLFSYKICPFLNVTQIYNNEQVLLGNWEKWSEEAPQYHKMIYSGGSESGCNDSKKRSVEIKLSCSDNVHIRNLEESPICHYKFELECPTACGSVELPHVHDEL